jgi:hypothetical protein
VPRAWPSGADARYERHGLGDNTEKCQRRFAAHIRAGLQSVGDDERVRPTLAKRWRERVQASPKLHNLAGALPARELT